MGIGGNNTEEGMSGGAGTVDDIQGGGLDVVDLWEWELGDYESDVDGYIGFSSLVGQKHFEKDSSTC